MKRYLAPFLFFLTVFFAINIAGITWFLLQPDSVEISEKPEEVIEVIEDVKEEAITQDDINQNPLYTHDTYIAFSEDGFDWELSDDPIAPHASVPDIIELKEDIGDFQSGTLLAYYVDGQIGEDQLKDTQLGLSYSSDSGSTWTRISAEVSFELEGGVIADPSLVELEDGRLRLYFYNFGVTKSGHQPAEAHIFYSAISNDGLTFEIEEEVFYSGTVATDPDVIFYNDKWYLSYADQESQSMKIATSDDPWSFQVITDTHELGIPTMIEIDEELVLYGCDGGITKHVSTDNGNKFNLAGIVDGLEYEGLMCDPSIFELSDGGYVMVLKTIEYEFLTIK